MNTINAIAAQSAAALTEHDDAVRGAVEHEAAGREADSHEPAPRQPVNVKAYIAKKAELRVALEELIRAARDNCSGLRTYAAFMNLDRMYTNALLEDAI